MRGRDTLRQHYGGSYWNKNRLDVRKQERRKLRRRQVQDPGLLTVILKCPHLLSLPKLWETF